MGDSWIEPRTRIPFVGIIAMVIIVAIVAVFIKTQLGPMFPKSDVKIEAESANAAGHASASFYGVREIQLQRTEYLQGVLSTSQRSMSIVVEPASKLLILTEGSRREEIKLHEDSDKIAATFEYDGVPTNIRVDPVSDYLLYTEPGKSAVQMQVPLSNNYRYQGFFTVRNRQYLFQFMPASGYATILGSSTDNVNLNVKGTTYTGIWDEAGKEHPVTIDATKMIATVEEIY